MGQYTCGASPCSTQIALPESESDSPPSARLMKASTTWEIGIRSPYFLHGKKFYCKCADCTVGKGRGKGGIPIG